MATGTVPVAGPPHRAGSSQENVGIDSSGELYDAIDVVRAVDDQRIGRASVGVRYALYWLATAAGIRPLATLLKWAVRLVLFRVPDVMWGTAHWYERGKHYPPRVRVEEVRCMTSLVMCRGRALCGRLARRVRR